MGFGHITRCSSIYQAFNEIGIIPQFIVNGDESIHNLLKDINHETFDWINNQKKLLATLKDADIVFVDSYHAGYNLYKEISSQVKTAVYLDDNMRLEYPKGFVLNGAISAEQLPYPENKDVDYLLGVQFAPLRKEFWDTADKQVRDEIEVIMVTFGGTDIHGLTSDILRMLTRNYPDVVKKCIIGNGFKNTAKIENIRDNNTDLIFHPAANDMKSVILESDIAISACGQTLYELACVGVPTIAVTVADNQSTSTRGWQKAGFIEYGGHWSKTDLSGNIKSLIDKLKCPELRRKNSCIGRNFVDGKGALRIAKYFS